MQPLNSKRRWHTSTGKPQNWPIFGLSKRLWSQSKWWMNQISFWLDTENRNPYWQPPTSIQWSWESCANRGTRSSCIHSHGSSPPAWYSSASGHHSCHRRITRLGSSTSREHSRGSALESIPYMHQPICRRHHPISCPCYQRRDPQLLPLHAALCPCPRVIASSCLVNTLADCEVFDSFK